MKALKFTVILVLKKKAQSATWVSNKGSDLNWVREIQWQCCVNRYPEGRGNL